MENQFPGNSHQDKEKPTAKKAAPEKKVEKIVTGEVVQRKKPLGKKFKEFIVGDDSKSVIHWIWGDVLVPGAKDVVYDALTGGLEKRMFGEARGRRRGGIANSAVQQIFGNAAYNPYNRYSASSTSLRQDNRGGLPNRRGRAQMRDLGEILFTTRAEATEVLDAMIAIIAQYQSVTVADFWELLGKTGEPTDENFGWTELLGADVISTGGVYLLELPNPHKLD